MNRKICTLILLVMTLLCISTVYGASFKDMEGHWAKDVVYEMANKGILNGFEDGTFRPNESVTREQFAKILVESLNLEGKNSLIKFQDVEENRWSQKYIEVASKYLTGYEINGKYYFKPTESCVREDVAVAVVMAKGLQNETPNYSLINNFSDEDKISDSLRKYIAIAVEHKIMIGKGGYFDPQGALTRAEVSQLLYNVSTKGPSEEAVENIEKADIKVGDFVTYQSDLGDIECRVWEVKSNGSIIIMPSSPQGTLTLGYAEGTTGSAQVSSAATSYLNAETLITNKCKEYISTKLGVEAGDIESLTIEELNEKTGYSPTPGSKYAYYASGTSVSGVTTEEDGIAGYTKAEHSSYLYDIITPRFYTYDYAKNTTTDERGNIYAYPTSTDPVFVTNTCYYYDPSEYNSTVSEMLGSSYGWLASSCVSTSPIGMYFAVHGAYSRHIDNNTLCYSTGGEYRISRGVRPLITLSSTLKLDSSVSVMDGTSEKPWQFVK